jgi:two-component system response regulator (stage 0 sporulation protein A)
MINSQKLENAMLELGHPENLSGTGYLREGVELYNAGLTRMTKELYPAIAKAANTTPARVERAMRHSISAAWARSCRESQQRFFGNSINPETGTPTVGEYVARMARICRED